MEFVNLKRGISVNNEFWRFRSNIFEILTTRRIILTTRKIILLVEVTKGLQKFLNSRYEKLNERFQFIVFDIILFLDHFFETYTDHHSEKLYIRYLIELNLQLHDEYIYIYVKLLFIIG